MKSITVKDSYLETTFIVELHAVYHYVVMEKNAPKSLLEELMASWGHHIYQYWKTDEGFEELKRQSRKNYYTHHEYTQRVIDSIKEEHAETLSNVISIEEWKKQKNRI